MSVFMSDYESVVAFSSPYHFDTLEEMQAHACSAGNYTTISHLAELGVGAIFVQKGDFKGLDNAASYAVGKVARLTREAVTLGHDVELPLGQSGVSVVRARSASPRPLDRAVSVVNEPSVRAIGASKVRQYSMFSQHMAPTIVFGPGEKLDFDSIANLQGESIVFKGDNGKQANKVVFGDKHPAILPEAEKLVRDDLGQSILVQERDPGHHWDGLRAFSSGDQLYADCISTLTSNHELRLCAFATKMNHRFFPIYKVNQDTKTTGGDRVILLDPESIPENALTLGRLVVDKIMEETDAPGLLAGIDLYKTCDDEIRIREVNLRDPRLSITANRLAPHLILHAEQLAELALNRNV